MSFSPMNRGAFAALKNSKIRGVWLAIVVDNRDGGDNPGYRVKLMLPWLSEQETTFWARIAVPMGGADRGTYVLPEIDDQVLVVFEHGDINRPIVIGGSWSKKQEPVEINQSGNNNTKLIKSRCGHRIIFDDKEGAEKITIVDRTKKNKIVLDSVNKIVKVESDGEIEVKAKTNVILHANALKIGATEGVTGKARSLLTHAQKTFGLKATSGITIGGGQTTINTSNAAATSVSGSGAGELGAPGAEQPKDQVAANGDAGGAGGGGSSGGGGAPGLGKEVPAAILARADLPPAGGPPPVVKPAAPPVNPVLTPASLVVVVAKRAKDPATGKVEPYTHPKRHAITLKTDAAFDGTATLSCDKPAQVKLFSAAKAGHEIKLDGTDNVFKSGARPPWAAGNLSSGVRIFVEAVAASAALDDITVKLALSGGSKPTGPDARSTITSVEVTLDLCKSRPAAGVAPPKLSPDDKIHVGRSLLVQNAAKHRERAQLIIQQVKPAAFKGTLVLKPRNGQVAAYDDEKPKAAGEVAHTPSLEIAANLVPAAGKILWAQAESPSGDMRDSGFVLGIKDVEDECDRVNVTAVKIQLDLCQSRKSAGADPPPLTEDDKVKVGRFVHAQDAAGHHARCLVVVRKVQPAKFKGTLVLAGANLPNIEAMPNERPTGGEAATGLPHNIDYDPAVAANRNEDKKFWIQGKMGAASGVLRDTQLFLHLQDDPVRNSDVAVLTVFQLVKAAATLKATPSKRAGVVSSNPTVDFVDDNKAFRATDLTLVKDCGELDVTTTVKPAGVPLTWDVEQAPDDKVKKAPSHRANGADTGKRLIKADAEGSFHVVVFNDGNGSGKREASESALVVNVHMVKIKVRPQAGSNRIFSGNFHAGAVAGGTLNVTTSNPGSVGAATNSVYADAILALEAVGMRVAVDVTGGGADQRRGLAKVGMGFIQHFPSDNFLGSFPAGKTVREVFINNPAAFPAFTIVPPPPPPPPPPPQPTIASFPVRDHKSATGKGYDAVINSSSDADGKGTALLAGGERWVVRFLDSPSVVMPTAHPVTGTALTSISGTNDFKDFLVAFSSDFDENFTVFADATWSVNFGSFAAGAWSAAGASVTTSGASMSTAGYPKEGEKTDMEHYPPGATEAWRLDAR